MFLVHYMEIIQKKYFIQSKYFWYISINSASFFVLSYIIIYIISQLMTMLAAAIYDFNTNLLYYKIEYFVDRSYWGFESVKTIFSIGPIVNLILGVILLLIYLQVKESLGKLKFLFMWAYLNAFNLFLSAIILGSFNNTGFGNVLNWSYVMDTGRLLHVIIAGTFLIACGLFSTRPVLISANTYFKILNLKSKKIYAYGQVFGGAIIGIIAITIARIPYNADNNYFNLLGLFLIMIIILPILFRYNSFPDVEYEFEEGNFPNKILIDWKYIIISIVVLAIYRFGLS